MALAARGILVAETSSVAKPGVGEFRFAVPQKKLSGTTKIGVTADWVLVTDDAVWVGSRKPYAVLRIDPATNRIVATVRISGEACSGLASGFASIWAPVCGKKPARIRIHAARNAGTATLTIPPAGSKGGIPTSDDNVWLVRDINGTSVESIRSRIPAHRKSQFRPVRSIRSSAIARSGSRG